ncbi:MAG: response regulator [Cyclobacteriaceae bacterium]|nr:response regulator [Cyclobacteriaceae bacterium]
MTTKTLNKILIIDDNEIDQYITKSVIELAGIGDVTDVESNVSEALYYLQQCIDQGNPLPDLLLIDIHMPILNGWDFLTEYRKFTFDSGKEPVLIMFSSSINKNDRKHVVEFTEIAEFIEKPITVEKFQMIVEKHFNASYSPITFVS